MLTHSTVQYTWIQSDDSQVQNNTVDVSAHTCTDGCVDQRRFVVALPLMWAINVRVWSPGEHPLQHSQGSPRTPHPHPHPQDRPS